MNAGSRFSDPAGGPAVKVDRHGTDMVAMEAAAIGVLDSLPNWFWDAEPPVPVERIATDHFGLLVRESEDPAKVPGAPAIPEGDRLSGFLLAKRGEIWVNAKDAREWPPRRRFTIAHELGHWVLHRDLGEVMCRAIDSPGESRTGGQLVDSEGRAILARPEAEANAFAAALLLPAKLIRESHSESGGDIDLIQERFNSSRAALKRRFATLGLEFPPEPEGEDNPESHSPST
jgi:hypothetical protein